MIVFRVDANEQVATGHMMRCMAIALELKSMGEECRFYLAEKKYTERLEQNHISYRILDSKWNALHTELPRIEEYLKEDQPDWIVVDSYYADQEYLAALETMGKVLYVDDMEKEIYPVSAVLHYSDWLQDTHYQDAYCNRKTQVLVGTKYVPLRSEFFPASELSEKSILITTGGTDIYNIAGRVLKRIQEQVMLHTVTARVIVGQMNQYKAELERYAEENPWVKLYCDVNNMGELMRKSTYAVSAGGTTLFELCACQIPTVCFSFADNQQEFVEKMGKEKVMVSAGDVRRNPEMTVGSIVDKLICLMNNEEMCQQLKENMKNLVDGKGTSRIAEFLCKH